MTDAHEGTFASDGLDLAKAWLSNAPRDGKARPAIVYGHGGYWFNNEDWDALRRAKRGLHHFVNHPAEEEHRTTRGSRPQMDDAQGFIRGNRSVITAPVQGDAR